MAGFGYTGMLFGGWLTFLIWALVIGGIGWLVVSFKHATQAHVAPVATQSPLDVVRILYLRGEITREQYEQMMRDLGA